MFTKKLAVILSVFFLIVAPLAQPSYALEIVVSGNADGSENSISVTSEESTHIEQTNQAEVDNSLLVNADTGGNIVSENTGGETLVETGKVDSQIDVLNVLNSSTVEDTCCLQDTNIQVEGNGSDSMNLVDLVMIDKTATTINQEAVVINKVKGVANSGKNKISSNGGDIVVKTGDVKVRGHVENGPVNLSNTQGGFESSDLNVAIINNAGSSKNKIAISPKTELIVNNDYVTKLDNQADWDLNTGKNDIKGNQGNVFLGTGDIDFNFQIVNGPINIGGAISRCCRFFDPGDPANPDDPGENNDPGQSDNGSWPPFLGGTDSGGDPGGGESGDNTLLTQVAAMEISGPAILGLSDTSGDMTQGMAFWVGLFMMALGVKAFGEVVLDYNSSRKNGQK